MRIPMTKLYRAFPELDTFDEFYCGYMLRELNRPVRVVLARHAVLFGAYVVLLVLTAVALGLVAVVAGLFYKLPIKYEDVVIYFILLVWFNLPYVGCLVLRDVMLRRKIRRWLENEPGLNV